MPTETRHILSLSGGKDSAALAVYMRDRVPQMEYIFHDTDKELPETYAYLELLQSVLGKEIHKTKPGNSFFPGSALISCVSGSVSSGHTRRAKC